jgi:hypothetical protein
MCPIAPSPLLQRSGADQRRHRHTPVSRGAWLTRGCASRGLPRGLGPRFVYILRAKPAVAIKVDVRESEPSSVIPLPYFIATVLARAAHGWFHRFRSASSNRCASSSIVGVAMMCSLV